MREGTNIYIILQQNDTFSLSDKVFVYPNIVLNQKLVFNFRDILLLSFVFRIEPENNIR